ncbi:DUF3553 domain-containing protein [Candidatus Microgenomates bacterium]|nr:DUF3553 domain-containing protein [Candidatus Microgenomates bacterium]
MKDLLADLNEPQRAAVLHPAGPLLILAGAGSGKTKTLTHRIAYLVAKRRVEPAHILAVTFTNKAAGEMRQRVASLLGHSGQDRRFMSFLGTFHAVCVRLLRQEAATAGLSSQFAIFDAQDSQAAIKQAMRRLQIDEKRYQPGLIRSLISSAKNELIDAAAYPKLASGPVQQVAARVYPVYQQLLNEASALDFDDLLMLTVHLFRRHPTVLHKWQRQFAHILIDEYQDTNQAQYELVKLLAAAHRNICVVGDDWQSIYGWRGANFKNILGFERDYPEAKVIKLEQNYRSTQKILDAAQAIITKNQQRSEKALWTKNSGGRPVRVWPVRSEAEEAELVMQSIREATGQGERQLRDFVVLYRANAQSRSLEEAFLRAGMPYRVVGGVRFYERKEIKDVLAYLSLIHQPNHLLAWQRIVNVPPRGLGKKSLEAFLGWWQAAGLSLGLAMDQVGDVPGLTPRAQTALAGLGRLLKQLREQSTQLPVADLINLVIKRTGYLDYLNDGSILAADRIENVQELMSVAQSFEGLGLDAFLEEVALVSDIDEYDVASEAVTFMTLHAAKGLEFPVVYMIGMEEGVFPHARSLLDPDQLEEERRLCYVGMTRAREELNLVYATSRLLYGATQHNPPARFIAELEDLIQLAGQRGTKLVEAPLPAGGDRLKEGDMVNHDSFGVGTVVELKGDEITVEFEDFGPKRLSASFATLEKL